MAATNVFRPVGPTIALSVTASSHAAVALQFTTSDQVNFAACINTGTVAVAVTFSVAGTASTLPVDGTPGSFMLPASMQQPIVLAIPAGAVQVTAIGAAAGPSLVYITPVGDQS